MPTTSPDYIQPQNDIELAVLSGGVHPGGLLIDIPDLDSAPADVRSTITKLDTELKRRMDTANRAVNEIAAADRDRSLSLTGKTAKKKKLATDALQELKNNSKVEIDGHRVRATYKVQADKDPLPEPGELPTGVQMLQRFRDDPTDSKRVAEEDRETLLKSAGFNVLLTTEVRFLRSRRKLDERDTYFTRAIERKDSLGIQACRYFNQRGPLDGPAFTPETFEQGMLAWRTNNNPVAMKAVELLDEKLKGFRHATTSLSELLRQAGGLPRDDTPEFHASDGTNPTNN
ncbi:MAG: hypothetical protein AAF916_04675 [Planctomycetota bacterium]